MDPSSLIANFDDWEEFRGSFTAVPNEPEVNVSFQFEFAAYAICMDNVLEQANVFTIQASPSDFSLLEISWHQRMVRSTGASWEEYARHVNMIVTIDRTAEGAFEVSGLVTKSFLEHLGNRGVHDPIGAVGHTCYATVFKLNSIGVFGGGPSDAEIAFYDERSETLSELSEEASAVVLSSESDSEMTPEWPAR